MGGEVAFELLTKYKAHSTVLRKTWDRSAQSRMFARAAGPQDAVVIIDYGQKVLPEANTESQSDCFGKAGFSQFGATFLMRSAGFTADRLVAMLGDAKVNSIKPDDFVVYTAVLYNKDAHQDWVHSFLSLRTCLRPQTFLGQVSSHQNTTSQE